MTIDAIDILRTEKHVNGFCIIAADNDFSSLIKRLGRDYFVAGLWCHDVDDSESVFREGCGLFVHVSELPVNVDPEATSLYGLNDVIRNAVERTTSSETGWSSLSKIGNILSPAKSIDYCHGSLLSLIESCDEFEVMSDRQLVMVRVVSDD